MESDEDKLGCARSLCLMGGDECLAVLSSG